MNKPELLEARALFVRQYIENGNKRGVKTTFSVKALSEKVLFVTERTIYDDLKRAKLLPLYQEHEIKEDRQSGNSGY